MDNTLRAARSVAGPVPAQTTLPFEQDPPCALPFDDEADRPVDFVLTARARRVVAPASVPALSVVSGPADDDPSDTRPARARALRRAGSAVSDIAAALHVDDLLVAAWVGDLPAAGPGRPPSRGSRAAAVLRAPVATSPDTSRVGTRTGRVAGEVRLGEIRRDAATAARQRLLADPRLAVDAGLLAGVVTVDSHAAVFRTSRRQLAARLVNWSYEQAEAQPRDVRVVLRLGADVPADIARHRWAAELGLGLEQVAATRWRQAPGPDAEEALVRLSDPAVAARLAGWCDAVLQPDLDPADVAF